MAHQHPHECILEFMGHMFWKIPCYLWVHINMGVSPSKVLHKREIRVC